MLASRSVESPRPLTPDYEAVVCDVCGSTDGAVAARIPALGAVADPLQRFCLDGLAFPKEGITLVICSLCGFGYQNPRLSDGGMGRFYERFYDPEGPRVAYHRTPHPDLERARYDAIVEAGYESGVVLDVGAGKGYALEAFPPGSWSRHALDVSSEALRILAARLPDAKVHEGSLSRSSLPSGAFDVVTMNSTLEHVRDPVDTLVAAREALRPGGLLVFNVPNLRSPSLVLARGSGQRWIGFTPEHLSYFSVRVLASLAPTLGFREARHHTVGYEEARPRWPHLGHQAATLASGMKRLALRRPEGMARVVIGLSIVADWPFSSTCVGRRLRYGENITGFWRR